MKEISVLHGYIKSKKIPSYLIFTGDEWKVQEIYINQIAKVTGKNTCRVDSVSEIFSSIKNRSFVNTPKVYIVRDDSDLMQNEKLQAQINSGILGENFLIHIITSVDKRTKFYKLFKDDIFDFKTLSDDLLSKYTLKEITLSNRNLKRLLDVCEHDYGRILLEVDKIKRYQKSMIKVGNSEYVETNQCVTKLLQDGTIYEPPYDAIFDFVKAVLLRYVDEAFDLLNQCYAIGESTMVMLTVLYNNAKAVLQVQSYEGSDISKATGLTGWQVKCAKEVMGNYSIGELCRLVRLVSEVERGIKSGTVEEQFAMQYILASVM